MFASCAASTVPRLRRRPYYGWEGGGKTVRPPGGGVDHETRPSAQLYAELRVRAERFMRGQPCDLALQTTVLVHEASLDERAGDHLAVEIA